MIVVDVFLLTRNKNRQIDLVKKYKRELDTFVLHKIMTNKKFMNSGLPINVLTLSNLIIRHQAILEYTFEIKGNTLPEE